MSSVPAKDTVTTLGAKKARRNPKNMGSSASQFRGSAGAYGVKTVSQPARSGVSHALAKEADTYLNQHKGKDTVSTTSQAEALQFVRKWCLHFKIPESSFATALGPGPATLALPSGRALVSNRLSLPETGTASVFNLNADFITAGGLRCFGNEFASQYGNIFLGWFDELKQTDQEWKVVTVFNISDLVVKFVGVTRTEGLLVEEFIDEQKWKNLRTRDDIIYVLESLLPAEYLVLVDFQSGNRTLKSRLHRILLRLCSVNRFRIDFRLQQLALSSNMLFKARHLCELTSTHQVRLFRALSELYYHGSSIDYLCSVYGVNKEVFHELIDWVLENVSVAESRVFSAFFDLHERVDSAKTIPLTVFFQTTPGLFLPQIWCHGEHMPVYLQDTLNLLQDADLRFYNPDILIGNFSQQAIGDLFISMFLSVNLIEDATSKINARLKDWSELWEHYDALRSVLSPALIAVLDYSRPICAGAYSEEHEVSLDCVLLAMNWAKMKLMRACTGEFKEAVEICDRLIESEMIPTPESLLFCAEIERPHYVPEPLRLLELLLDVTDKRKSAGDVRRKYPAMTEESMKTIMEFVKHFAPGYDAAHFDIGRLGAPAQSRGRGADNDSGGGAVADLYGFDAKDIAASDEQRRQEAEGNAFGGAGGAGPRVGVGHALGGSDEEEEEEEEQEGEEEEEEGEEEDEDEDEDEDVEEEQQGGGDDVSAKVDDVKKGAFDGGSAGDDRNSPKDSKDAHDLNDADGGSNAAGIEIINSFL